MTSSYIGPGTAVLTLVSALLVLGCAVRQVSNRPAPPFAAVVGPAIIAHRGGALEAPENTVAAIQHGVEAGADWQEIDVTLSSDGYVVVIHDDTLDRTTDGEGRVDERPLAELTTFFAGRPAWAESVAKLLAERGIEPPDFGDTYAGERVPELASVLAVPGARLMIEMKRTHRRERLVEAVLAAVYEAQAADRVALASFDDRLLYEAYRRDPSIPLIGIANSDEGIRTMLELPLAAIATRADLVEVSQERVPAGVAVWAFTAYSSDDAAELRNRGVHGIITDVPRAVVGSLRAEPDLYVRPNEP